MEIQQQLQVLENLQLKELKVYERFLISLEQQVRQLLPQINQPELLSEMMSQKKSMMSDIISIEQELSPLRKEVGLLSKDGKLDMIDPSQLEKLKSVDLTIIDLISKISRTEQELTQRIKEQMEMIKGRLQQIGQERQIQTKYERPTNFVAFEKPADEAIPSKFDTAG